MTKARKGASPLDVAMAALAAASVGFAVFAMPDGMFNDAVALSGLPMVLPAANPPLGTTARLAALIVAACASFALVYLVLRSLGAKPSAPKRRVQIQEIDVAPPKLRRADAHPDAPSRRPILAGLDLGEPFPADQSADEPADVQPADLQPGDEPVELQPEPVAQDAEPAYPGFLVPDEPREVEEGEFAEPAAQAEEQDSNELTAAEQLEVEQPATGESGEARDDHASISNLMQRLERGLERRASGTPSSPAAAPGRQDRIDERLRTAISDLQKLSARHG